jgi:hypothetical protein
MSNTTENKIDFDNPNGSEFSTGDYSGHIKTGEWIELSEVKGVRYRTWKYEEINSELVDGALVEIQPGCRTPVQYVETDHVFEENFQKGKFLVIKIDTEGDLVVYKYDSALGQLTLEVEKGEIMCLYAIKENDEPGEVIECEQPGFSTANLVTVKDNTEKIGDLEIPNVFWQLIRSLDNGMENDLPINVVDLSEEM